MAGINFDFTTGSLPAGIAFTRASIGTYTNATGTLITASNDVARFNYVAGVSNLLIEGSATNLLTNSNNFSNAVWTANGGATIAGAQFISPDGSNNGWVLTSSVVNGFYAQLYPYSNTLYTISIWAKTITGATAPQLLLDGINSGAIAASSTLTRWSFSGTTGAGSHYAGIQVVGATGTEGIYGAQLETGNKVTSYIPTTTTAVTRAADSAVFTIPAGVTALQFTFDDNSTQVVSVTPGPYTIPTTLNRPNIKSIQSAFVLDFTSGSLPAGMTFTRPSIGTYTNAGGTLITAGNDVARMNYVAGVSNLLIEPAATNLFIQSNNFSDAGWIKYNSVSLAAAQFVSPDGTNNGWSIMMQGLSGGAYQVFTFSNIPYTISAWTKFISGSTNTKFAMDGKPAVIVTTTSTLTRFSATITPFAGPENGVLQMDGTSGTNGVYGAQLETGSVPTSYIPTTTAAVTRAADQATFTIPTGVTQLTYTFDDNSTQVVSATAGSYTIPVNLSRPNIKSITWVTQELSPPLVQLGRFQSLSLAAGSPVQITTTGTYRLAILNTGPGNLYVSSTATPGVNAQSMLIPPLKMAPYTTTAAAIWLSADQAGGVSIAAMPR